MLIKDIFGLGYGRDRKDRDRYWSGHRDDWDYGSGRHHHGNYWDKDDYGYGSSWGGRGRRGC